MHGEAKKAEKFWPEALVVTAPDKFTIYAWMVAHEGTLMHVYVVPGMREAGIARSLVEHTLGKTYMVAKPWPLRTPMGHNVTYNPYE